MESVFLLCNKLERSQMPVSFPGFLLPDRVSFLYGFQGLISL